jgi:hypothetical protein
MHSLNCEIRVCQGVMRLSRFVTHRLAFHSPLAPATGDRVRAKVYLQVQLQKQDSSQAFRTRTQSEGWYSYSKHHELREYEYEYRFTEYEYETARKMWLNLSPDPPAPRCRVFGLVHQQWERGDNRSRELAPLTQPPPCPLPRFRGKGQGEGVFRRTVILILTLLWTSIGVALADEQLATAARIEGTATLEVNVGMSGTLEQVVLPGAELSAKVVDPRSTAIILRIDAVYAHGDDYRYDFTWFGMESGSYNLTDYLSRVDGTSTDDLPSMSVTVNSVLPAGRIRPNIPDQQSRVTAGGYRTLLITGGVIWVLGLFVILFAGRNKTSQSGASQRETPLTRLQQIEKLLQQAVTSTQFEAADKAQLEGLIVGFWTERKGLQRHDPKLAIEALKEDPDAAPLLGQLERWLYDRPSAETTDITELLQPLRNMIATASRPGIAANESQASGTAQEPSR